MHNNGDSNTAVGVNALVNNATGAQNTAVGQGALAKNALGGSNTAIGFAALSNNDSSGNTATGWAALRLNTNGLGNTANGNEALHENTTGDYNTAVGDAALLANDSGSYNTGIDNGALFNNTLGRFNTAVGGEALLSNNGSNNVGIGFQAGENITGNFNIDIGNNGVVGDANTIRIGASPLQTRTFIAGIRGKTTGVANAIPVVIDTAGQLGTISSSRRFKDEIKSMDKASEAILALKPVTFHYKSDSTGTSQFGLIAEEVAKVNPDLVVRDKNGDIYTVRYEAVNAMLLNEFLKEHKAFLEEQRTVHDLKAIVGQQQKQIAALTAGLEKVSAQIEVSKPAPQTVANNQ